MHKRKSVLLKFINSPEILSTDIHSYCGYCCKLIEIKSDHCSGDKLAVAGEVVSIAIEPTLPTDDNNTDYIILCASCQGPFHVCCTALSATPVEKISEQCLNWKCNACVKPEVPNGSSSTDSSPDDPDHKLVDYSHKHRDDLIDKRLTVMLCMFGKDLQNVCGKIVETDDLDKELAENYAKRDDYLAISSIPYDVKTQFLQDLTNIAMAKGIKLIQTSPKEEKTVPTYSTTTTISDNKKISFVIRLDSQATRQLLLSTYLNSIMHPIAMQHHQQPSNKPTSFYLANDRDIEVNSTTCLLPHNNNNQQQPSITSNYNHRNRSIYMYEYLATNPSSSSENQTMLVKAIRGKGVDNDYDSSVFHEEPSNIIVPIIKISGVPKRVRLASKENFDDIEGKFMNKHMF